MPPPRSLHRLHPGGERGPAVRDLPAVPGQQLRSQLLLQHLPRQPPPVAGPGLAQRRGGADLGHGPALPPGRHQRRRQLGPAPAHPGPISLGTRAGPRDLPSTPSGGLLPARAAPWGTAQGRGAGTRAGGGSAGPARPVLAPNSAPKWLKQTFDEADKNGDGSLSIGEVLQLLHKLNVNLPRQRVKQMFKVRQGVPRGSRPAELAA